MKYYENTEASTRPKAMTSIEASTRPKAMNLGEAAEKEEEKEGQTYFRKKLFAPGA